MNPIRKLSLVLAVIAVAGCAAPQAGSEASSLDARTAAALASSFTGAPPEWQQRLVQDEVQKQCSSARGKPSGDVAGAIVLSQQAALKYPDSGLMGDWKNGEKIAQSGVGLQFSDKPGTVPGGNCYACHQIAKTEIAHGTIGPSLLGYGKLRGQSEAIQKYTYGKIYNAQAYVPCSLMPRFGHKGILNEQQMKDLTALLLDPASPVNQ
ncbi:sulfur oxidation c-type cytochrome SoxX [Nevskia sp.]|uniref:sulfur oxidation c-type cytochrome SoxX n=1 Tax=Nevskia sp. TaxID=1929292 RepID=UPI0025EB012E|nr:sulfur oxidation c-type cytochrome SoxX [Nevskia sp.]